MAPPTDDRPPDRVAPTDNHQARRLAHSDTEREAALAHCRTAQMRFTLTTAVVARATAARWAAAAHAHDVGLSFREIAPYFELGPSSWRNVKRMADRHRERAAENTEPVT